MKLVELGDGAAHGELLATVYRDVLLPSFRPDELEPLEVTAAGLAARPRDKDVIVALDDRDEVLGVAIGDWYPDSRVSLLSYLATRPGLRSQGVGSALMGSLPSRWQARGALLALAEVDDPRVHEVSEVGDPSARLRFYARFGAEVLDMAYVQPRVRPGGDRVRGMLLLSFAIQPEALVGGASRALRAEILSSFLSRYYDDAEGPEGDDAERAEILRRVTRRPGVAILPLSRYAEVPLAPADGEPASRS